ncbi:MAG: hypothetical protein EpisKO_41740 [Epibacterium sp.]
MKKLKAFALASSVILTTGCATSMAPVGGIDATEDTASEAEICRQWGQSLATRSRLDTQQTIDEIQSGYAAFSLSCPGWEHLIP